MPLLVWTLVFYSLRLLPIADAPESPAFASQLDHRFALANACVDAAGTRLERFLCMRVARFESSYRADVSDCTISGEGGSLSAWQVIPRSESERTLICKSLQGAARLFIERVRESRQACRRLPPPEQLAVYARGSCWNLEGRRLSRVRFPSEREMSRTEADQWLAR